MSFNRPGDLGGGAIGEKILGSDQEIAIGTFCVSDNIPEDDRSKLMFKVKGNNEDCYDEWIYYIRCEDCCDLYPMIALERSPNDDCCYIFSFRPYPLNAQSCPKKYLNILYPNGEYEIINMGFLENGQLKSINFCMSPNQLKRNGNNIITFQFLNSDLDEIVCEKTYDLDEDFDMTDCMDQCCNDINITCSYVKSQDPAIWYWNVHITQDPDSECKIYGYEIIDDQSRIFADYFKYSDDDPYGLEVIDINQLGIINFQTNDYNTIPVSLSIVFYDENGNEICTKEFPCSLQGTQKIPVNENFIKNEIENKIYDIGFYPNPTNDEGTLYFTLEDDTILDIEIYNNTGQLMSSNENRFIQGKNLLSLNIENFVKGVYYVLLSNNNFSKSIPIIIR